MRRIKAVVDDFILPAPLAIVCKSQRESQQRPQLLVHGKKAERDRQNVSLVKNVHEIADQDGVMLVIQPQIHGCKAHHRHDHNGCQIPQQLRKTIPISAAGMFLWF